MIFKTESPFCPRRVDQNPLTQPTYTDEAKGWVRWKRDSRDVYLWSTCSRPGSVLGRDVLS